MNSQATFSYGPLHIDKQVLADQIETYLQQLYMDTRCSLKDQLEAMDDRDEWGERESLGKSVLAA